MVPATERGFHLKIAMLLWDPRLLPFCRPAADHVLRSTGRRFTSVSWAPGLCRFPQAPERACSLSDVDVTLASRIQGRSFSALRSLDIQSVSRSTHSIQPASATFPSPSDIRGFLLCCKERGEEKGKKKKTQHTLNNQQEIISAHGVIKH